MANGPMPIGPQVISGMRRAPKPKHRTGGSLADYNPYESSGWGTLAGDTSAPPPPPSPLMPARSPAPFNYYPGFNNAAQGQSMGIGINVLGAGTGGPPLPVTNSYALGTAPIQRKAAGASGYASSFEKARAMNKPGGGLLTNAEAGSLYDNTGYMPSVTIGGNWNRPQLTTRHPLAHLSSRQQKDLMRVDANTAAYEAQQEARRSALSTGMSNEQAERFAGRRGLATRRDEAGNVIGLRGSAPAAPTVDPYTLEQRNVSYRALRGDEIGARRAAVQANAAQRSQSRRDTMEARRQGPSLIDYIAARNPIVAMRVMELRQQGRIAEADMELRRGAQDIQRQEVEQRGALATRGLDIEEGRTETEARLRAEENALRRTDTENRYRLGDRGLNITEAQNRQNAANESARLRITSQGLQNQNLAQQGTLEEMRKQTTIAQGGLDQRKQESVLNAYEKAAEFEQAAGVAEAEGRDEEANRLRLIGASFREKAGVSTPMTDETAAPQDRSYAGGRIGLGGTANRTDMENLEMIKGNRQSVVEYMQNRMGLEGDALRRALNEFYNPSNTYWRLSEDDPYGWYNMLTSRSFGPRGEEQKGLIRSALEFIGGNNPIENQRYWE